MGLVVLPVEDVVEIALVGIGVDLAGWGVTDAGEDLLDGLGHVLAVETPLDQAHLFDGLPEATADEEEPDLHAWTAVVRHDGLAVALGVLADQRTRIEACGARDEIDEVAPESGLLGGDFDIQSLDLGARFACGFVLGAVVLIDEFIDELLEVSTDHAPAQPVRDERDGLLGHGGAVLGGFLGFFAFLVPLLVALLVPLLLGPPRGRKREGEQRSQRADGNHLGTHRTTSGNPARETKNLADRPPAWGTIPQRPP